LALVIDTRTSLNLNIKHKKTDQQFICHYTAFQQYVAVIPRSLANLSRPQFNNLGFSLVVPNRGAAAPRVPFIMHRGAAS